MKYFLTGGGGFLGLAMVRGLRKAGHEVVTYSRGEYPELSELGCTHIRGDLQDLDALTEASKGCDGVFHVAAKAGIWGRFGDFYAANVVGTQNVLLACFRNGTEKLVYTSTPSVVHDGEGSEGKDESLPYPKSFLAHYPATKALAEQEVLAADGDKLATVALRPHLIWGPRDHHFLPRLVSKAKAGKLRILGDEPNKVDSIYIDSAARAHLLAMEHLAPGSQVSGKAYFISQNEPIPVAELINKILHAAGVEPVTRSLSPKIAYAAGALCEALYGAFGLKAEPPITRFVAKQLSTPHWYNVNAARKDFGFSPEISIDEGMEKLAAWIREEPRS